MATTYNKPLKTIVVKTIGGATINASDTATDPIASDALRDFEARGIMHIRKSGGETLVPFHAVDNIDVTASVTEVTRAGTRISMGEELPCSALKRAIVVGTR